MRRHEEVQGPAQRSRPPSRSSAGAGSSSTLGSKRFTIAANKKRKIKVRFSKRKRKLAKRLKRFKAKVVITEVDQRGNPRISSRVFILRAR